MLKSYEAIYDHGRIQWLSEQPKVEHFKMLVVVEQSESAESNEYKQKRRTPPPDLKNSMDYRDEQPQSINNESDTQASVDTLLAETYGARGKKQIAEITDLIEEQRRNDWGDD